ncbi:hypothetical protein MRX96_015025 [Rhipicephalus microplus]
MGSWLFRFTKLSSYEWRRWGIASAVAVTAVALRCSRAVLDGREPGQYLMTGLCLVGWVPFEQPASRRSHSEIQPGSRDSTPQVE